MQSRSTSAVEIIFVLRARRHMKRLFSLSRLVRVSEVIPTAAVERPLSEVGVPGAKESSH